MIVCKHRDGEDYAIAAYHSPHWTVWRQDCEPVQLSDTAFDARWRRATGHIPVSGHAPSEWACEAPPPPPTRRWQDVTAEELAKELAGMNSHGEANYYDGLIRATATRLAEQDPPEVA